MFCLSHIQVFYNVINIFKHEQFYQKDDRYTILISIQRFKFRSNEIMKYSFHINLVFQKKLLINNFLITFFLNKIFHLLNTVIFN